MCSRHIYIYFLSLKYSEFQYREDQSTSNIFFIKIKHKTQQTLFAQHFSVPIIKLSVAIILDKFSLTMQYNSDIIAYADDLMSSLTPLVSTIM